MPSLRESREAWIRGAVIPALEPLADVLFSSAAFRREYIERVVAGFDAERADALLVVLLTYSPSQLALPTLQRTRLPIVIWNTQEFTSVTPSFSTGQMIDNHGVYGTQDLAYVLLRAGVPFHYHTSHPGEAVGQDELRDLFVAAAAVRRLSQVRVGLMGYPFPGMGDFAVDTTHLLSTLGCSWTNLALPEYIERSAAVAPHEAK